MSYALESETDLTNLDKLSVSLDSKDKESDMTKQVLLYLPAKALIFCCCFLSVTILGGLKIMIVKPISWTVSKIWAVVCALIDWAIDETLALVEGLFFATVAFVFLVAFFALIYNACIA